MNVDVMFLWFFLFRIAEFAKRVGPDEAAHNEPCYLVLTICCLIFEFLVY